MGTNETNIHRAARNLQRQTGLSYQKAHQLLLAAKTRPNLDSLESVAAFLVAAGVTQPTATTPGVVFVLNRGSFCDTGRCTTCRSWVDDIGPNGECYPCAALAVGDLIACAGCNDWIPRDEIRQPCDGCGADPTTGHIVPASPAVERLFEVTIDDEIGHTVDVFSVDDLPPGLQALVAEPLAGTVTWNAPDGGAWAVVQQLPDAVRECIAGGAHLESCDDDGYCNTCGYQDGGRYTDHDVTNCVHCDYPVTADPASPTGWTHVPRGGHAGGTWCNPEYTLDNEHTAAEPKA